MEKTILVCIHNEELELSLKRLCLRAPRNHLFIWADKEQNAFEYVKRNPVDLLILQATRPFSAFAKLADEFRSISNGAIFALFDSGNIDDLIFGLGLADDGMPLPLQTENELVARCLSLLDQSQLGLPLNAPQNAILEHRSIKLDWNAKKVSISGNVEPFTKTEIKILYLLMLHMDIVLSRQQIYDEVWKDNGYGIDDTVRSHIKEVRRKIAKYISDTVIETVTGLGYRISSSPLEDTEIA